MITEKSEAETRALILEAMKKGDSFRIRVTRRIGSGGLGIMASFEDGRADHIAYPEKWLPELAGGGIYQIEAFHATDAMTQIGSAITFNVNGQPQASIDWAKLDSPEWAGPRDCTFPKRPKVMVQQQHLSAEAPMQEQSVDIGRGLSTPVARKADDQALFYMERAQRAEAAVTNERNESARRMELDRVQRQADEKLNEMKRQHEVLLAELRALRTAEPKSSVMDDLAKLAPMLVPVLQTIMTNQSNMALKQAELAAQSSAQQLAAAKEASESLNKVLTAMMSKPAIDPVMLALLQELMKKSETNPMLNDMMSAFSGIMQTNLQVMTAATDAGLINRPNEGGGMGEIVQAISGAAASYFEMLANKQSPQQLQVPQVPQRAAPQLQQGQQQRRQQGPPARAVPAARSNDVRAKFNQLDQAVRAMAPPQQVAAFFLSSLVQDPYVNMKFKEAGNDSLQFFAIHWENWVREDLATRVAYGRALQEAVGAEAVRRGMVSPPEAQPATTPTQAVQPAAQAVVEQPQAAEQNGGEEPDEEEEDEEGAAPLLIDLGEEEQPVELVQRQ